MGCPSNSRKDSENEEGLALASPPPIPRKLADRSTWLPECHTERTYRDYFQHRAQWPLKRRAKPRMLGKPPLWKERAERWAAGLSARKWPSRAALARAEGVTRSYVTQVLGRLNSASKDRALNRINAVPTNAICCPRQSETAETVCLKPGSTRQ